MSESSAKSKVMTGLVAVVTVLLAVLVVLALRGSLTTGAPKAAQAKAGSASTIDEILNSAHTYMQQGEGGKSETVLKEAIAQYPEEQRLYISYGELMVKEKKPVEAYAQYEKALAIGPREAELEFTAGTVANMAGKLDRAVEHYAAAQARNARDYRIPLFLAQVQIKLEQLAEAKANLLLAGKLEPDKAVIWGTLGEIALRENKLDIALTHVAKARSIEPESVSWRLIEARALKRQNKPDAALELLIGLPEETRREPGVMPLMAECFGMLGRPKDAAQMYMKASESETGNAEYAMQAGLWLEKTGEKEAARRYAGRAKILGAVGAEELVERLK